MAGQNAEAGQLTWILGRPVEAVNSDGDTAMIDLRCERIGPPGRPMHSPDTSFRLTLHDIPTTGSATDAASDSATATVSIQREAATLWDAFLAGRTALDAYGWLLTIAGSRTDRWCVQAQRRPGVGTVHPFDNPHAVEGILTPSSPATLGTVAAQRRAYQDWMTAHGQTPEAQA
jgi:hypothetical protein